jgi:tetratricopeptide (TPR) repeat protein
MDRRGRANTPGSTLPLLVSTLHRQAVALQRAGKSSHALQVCRRILALAPELPEVLAVAAQASLALGEVEQAVSFYQAAVAGKRDFAEAHYNLGNALQRLGRTAAAVEAYRRAAKHRPDLVPVHNNLANALQALGRWDEAAQAYRRALGLDPGIAELHRNLGTVLQASGDGDGAAQAFGRAIALKPDWSRAHSSLANHFLERREPRSLIAACDAWLAACPGSIEAIGLKSVALDQLGDRAGARYLVDLDRLVRVRQFDAPPDGFASMGEFNAGLARHALGHPTLALPPQASPHYHCPTLRITDDFLAEPKGPAAALERMMNDATRDYLARLEVGGEHPFALQPPRRWKLTSWAAVLDGQGNLAPHIHYDGYVSGVYYCQLPGMVARGPGQAGWFELGRLPDRFGSAVVEVRAIQPREGMMILFPSYFYHRTVPFEAAETRISIAFDAMPISQEGQAVSGQLPRQPGLTRETC